MVSQKGVVVWFTYQIAMEDVASMEVLESTEDLVEE